MSNKADLVRILLHNATCQVRLCRMLLQKEAMYDADCKSAHRRPTRLQLQRAKLWDDVQKEIASLIKDHAKSGPELLVWLQNNPEAEITRAAKNENERDEVLSILRRLKGNENIEATRKLLGILEGVTPLAIKECLKDRKRWKQ